MGRRSSARGTTASVVALALAGLSPDMAWAQEAPVVEDEETDVILVTGSRIKRNGFAAPVPLTVVDSGLIADLGQTNTADVLRIIPQNIATNSDATSGLNDTADIGAAYANLRGLNPTFGTRTLTLVNSRRVVPTSDGGQVDLNLMPSILIGRVETVTGGASAAYGSDAVAGVVNVLLDTNFKGFKAQLDYGQTGRGDGKTFHGAAAYGASFAGGRGHILVGGEYERKRGIDRCAESRDWCAEGWAIYENASTVTPGLPNRPANVSGYNVPGSPGYGLPNYILGRNSGGAYDSPYGAIRNRYANRSINRTSFSASYEAINAPFEAVDMEFSPDGLSVHDYNPGAFVNSSTSGQAMGGDNLSTFDNQYIQTPVKRYSAYFGADYEMSDALKVSLELSHAWRSSKSVTTTAATRTTMPIKGDNAFLPASLVTLLNGGNFSLGKNMSRELRNILSNEAKVWRGVLGFSGEISSDWNWNAYYQYGKNKRHSAQPYSRHNDAFAMAIDAVRDGSGNIVCRPLDPTHLAVYSAEYQSKLLALHADCVPLNLFGEGNMDPDAVAFAWRPVFEDFSFRQHALSASMQGQLFDGWGAGPISIAFGADYRNDRGTVTHGDTDPSDYAFTFGLDYSGGIEVMEGFLETNVPVFRDAALGDFLELNGAIRYTRNKSTDLDLDQSKSVKATSWKIGAIYDVTDGIRFRGTQSRDIRAGGFRELFQKEALSEEGTPQGRVNNANISGPTQLDDTPIYTGGNFSITPEKADTRTLGIVLTPGFMPGFQMSLDWYKIKLKDAIADLNGQRVADLCILYDVNCDRITFASPTDIIRIDAGQANVGTVRIRGFDFETSYRLPLTNVSSSMDGVLGIRLLVNHQYDFTVQQSAASPAVNYAGQSGSLREAGDFNPTPKWMGTAMVSYDTEGFNVTLTARHVGKGILNADFIGPEDAGYDPTLPNSININRVKAATYFNLNMSYDLPVSNGSSIEVFGGIQNLFDKKPPVAGGGSGLRTTAYPTNPTFFDTFGMRWQAGARVSF